MRRTVTFSPFTRVEGDLHISVQIADGAVVEARVTSTLFRGFETILRGREPTDALVIVPRICGQCGAAHSVAAASALADLANLTPPPNAVLCRNIITATEAVLNNLTHFYLSFAADLAHPRYGESARRRFAPVRGTSFRRAIRARRAFLALMGLFAGKWPNTLAVQPGGVTKTITTTELVRARGVLEEFIEFVEEALLGGSIERFLEVQSFADLESWLCEGGQADSDLGQFVLLARRHNLDCIGEGPRRFLSTAGYPGPDGRALFSAGFFNGEEGGEGRTEALDPTEITEDACFAWLEAPPGGRHPLEGTTHPAPAKTEAYTWAKAPRYKGMSVEVGPLARALVLGVPLALDLLRNCGSTVFTRMFFRLREVVLLVRAVGDWLSRIDPEEPFCLATPQLEEGVSCGLVSAPRGLLGHWLRLEKGRIRNYQVVTPTGWNFSPRDCSGRPGPLEEALIGTPVADPDDAVEVAHVVRSFDPCLFCAVH